MNQLPPPQPNPGWYPDPRGGESQRYWDGDNWTSAEWDGGILAPAAAPPAPLSSPSLTQRWSALSKNTKIVAGLAAGISVISLIGLFADPKPPAGTATPVVSVAPTPPAAVPATVPMPNLVGKSYTASGIAITALGLLAHVDMQYQDTAMYSGCTATPAGSWPVVRTDPVAGTPLPRNGIKIVLFVDRSGGAPCAPPPPPPPPPPPAQPAAPINPPNVNLPNVNLPNINPCRRTKWC